VDGRSVEGGHGFVDVGGLSCLRGGCDGGSEEGAEIGRVLSGFGGLEDR
jgi:hypothetical protein